MSSRKNNSVLEILLHIVVWAYIFLSPLFIHPHEEQDWERIAMRTFFSLMLFSAFYLNYCWLVPKLFLEQRYRLFLASNIALLLCLAGMVELVLHYQLVTLLGITLQNDNCLPDHSHRFSETLHHTHNPSTTFHVTFYLRNVITFAFSWAAALAVRLSIRWRETEQARSDAERDRAEAELLNLKHQISPHFLLNTLNNIYALTAFDAPKAQSAILELSKMLRYQLYEEQGTLVELQKEVDFLKNYIALMRLRLSDRVQVTTDFVIPAGHSILVAPHIFISLVENAFKHGVSPTQESHIDIALHTDENKLRFVCRNSNHPKSAQDKATGGIGIQQVERQLAIFYPKHHSFAHGVNEARSEYHAEITLDLSHRAQAQ